MNGLFNSQFAVLLDNALFDPDYSTGKLTLLGDFRVSAGTVVCWVVSIVGFCLTAAAVIKLALSGLYLAYPRLWNKVSELHKQIEGAASSDTSGGSGQGGGGSAVVKKAAGFLCLILSLLPDVKSATEFGEGGANEGAGANTFEKKRWISKAIPEFLALSMIGVLIYFGYPTKLASWVGDTGTYILDAFFENVDPVQLTKKVITNIATYDLQTDSAANTYEQNVNDLTKLAMRSIYTKYSDMQSGPVQTTAYQVETILLQGLQEDSECYALLQKQDGYSVAYTVQLSSTTPVISSSYEQCGTTEGGGKLYKATTKSKIINYKLTYPIENLPTGSTKVTGTDYLIVTINCTPVALSATSSAKLTRVIAADGAADVGKQTYIISSIFNLETGSIKLQDTNVTIYYYNDSGVVTAPAGSQQNSINAYLNASSSQNGTLQLNSGSDTAWFNAAMNQANTGKGYVEVQLPATSGAYAMISTQVSGTEISQKVGVYSIRFAKGSDGWINRAWTDASSGSVTVWSKDTSSADFTKFFENKTSAKE